MERFKLPPWSKEPKLDKCAFEIYKNNKKIGIITKINHQKSVLFGRQKNFVDILLQHPSISRQHAAILHGKSGNIYVMDLGSIHGTFVNKYKLIPEQREPLKEKDVIQFGASTRKYIVSLSYDKTVIENKYVFSTKKEINEKKKSKKNETLNDQESIGCLHILIKHSESRRPSSWREEKIIRNKDEAIEIIKNYRKLIEEAENKKSKFESLAREFSDCNSHNRNGDLGKFKRGKMQKPFEDCAFSLSINELSKPVITASGIHLIFRAI